MSRRIRFIGRDSRSNTIYIYPKPIRRSHQGWHNFREYMAVSDIAHLIERWEVWDLNLKGWVSPPPEKKN